MSSEPELKLEPGIRVAQLRTQDPSPLSSHGNPLSSRVHTQVSAGPKDEPDKMLGQSSMQAPAPLSTKSPGHVHVPPIKVEPVKISSQALQAPPSSISPSGHVQVSPFPSKVDPGKMKSQSGTHLIPSGLDPGRPVLSFV